MKKTRRKPKTKSGRRIAMDLLTTSRCVTCKGPALITIPTQAKNGTKWKGYCFDDRPQEEAA